MSSYAPLKYIVFYIVTCIFTIYEYISNSQYDQLPVGLITQLVEHCTSITDDHAFISFSTVPIYVLLYIYLHNLIMLRKAICIPLPKVKGSNKLAFS